MFAVQPSHLAGLNLPQNNDQVCILYGAQLGGSLQQGNWLPAWHGAREGNSPHQEMGKLQILLLAVFSFFQLSSGAPSLAQDKPVEGEQMYNIAS